MTVVTVSDDGTVGIWDPETGKPRFAPLVLGGKAFDAKFSPDGEILLTSAEGEQRLWNARTGRALSDPFEGYFQSFSPNSHWVATSFDWMTSGKVEIRDGANGKLVGDPLLHESAVLDCSFTPDGNTTATQ